MTKWILLGIFLIGLLGGFFVFQTRSGNADHSKKSEVSRTSRSLQQPPSLPPKIDVSWPRDGRGAPEDNSDRVLYIDQMVALGVDGIPRLHEMLLASADLEEALIYANALALISREESFAALVHEILNAPESPAGLAGIRSLDLFHFEGLDEAILDSGLLQASARESSLEKLAQVITPETLADFPGSEDEDLYLDFLTHLHRPELSHHLAKQFSDTSSPALREALFVTLAKMDFIEAREALAETITELADEDYRQFLDLIPAEVQDELLEKRPIVK